MTLATLGRPAPNLARARRGPTRPTAPAVIGLAVVVLALGGNSVAASVLAGASLGLLPARRRITEVALVRTCLALAGVLAAVVGQALDYFDSPVFGWTPVLLAVVLAGAAWTMQRRAATWVRLPLGILGVVALLPALGLGSSLQAGAVLLGLLMVLMGTLHPQPLVSPVPVRSARGAARPR